MGRFSSHSWSYPIQTSAPAVELSHLFLTEIMAIMLNILNQMLHAQLFDWRIPLIFLYNE